MSQGNLKTNNINRSLIAGGCQEAPRIQALIKTDITSILLNKGGTITYMKCKTCSMRGIFPRYTKLIIIKKEQKNKILNALYYCILNLINVFNNILEV